MATVTADDLIRSFFEEGLLENCTQTIPESLVSFQTDLKAEHEVARAYLHGYILDGIRKCVTDKHFIIHHHRLQCTIIARHRDLQQNVPFKRFNPNNLVFGFWKVSKDATGLPIRVFDTHAFDDVGLKPVFHELAASFGEVGIRLEDVTDISKNAGVWLFRVTLEPKLYTAGKSA